MPRRHLLGLLIALIVALPAFAQTDVPPEQFTNALGMKFVRISPGKFQMGTPMPQRKGLYFGEIQHEVTLTKGFYLGVYAVTQKEWQAVMGKNPSRFQGENLPVERVTWTECQEFLQKLREKDKRSYRLPTEAEWEYACRAGTTTQYWFGDEITPLQANYLDEVYYLHHPGKPLQKTTPVGTFPPNAFGLYDMHGNVSQWCQDWHGKFTEEAVVDPQGPPRGEEHVWRGGSWGDNPVCCRSAWRGRAQPDSRDDAIGLRVAFTADD